MKATIINKLLLKGAYYYLDAMLFVFNPNEEKAFRTFWRYYISKPYDSLYCNEKPSQVFPLQHKFSIVTFKIKIHINAINRYVKYYQNNYVVFPFSKDICYYTDMTKKRKWKSWLQHYQYNEADEYPIVAVYLPVAQIDRDTDVLYGIVDGNHRATLANLYNEHPDVICIQTYLLPQEVFCDEKSWLLYLMTANYCQLITHNYPKDIFDQIESLLFGYLLD